ncbi:MAG: NAD(+)/NADH kinase [Oscillospiraceae bacterium]
MNKIAIVPNTLRDVNLHETRQVIKLLKTNHKVFLDEELKNTKIENVVYLPKAEMLKNADFIVVLGGDGTILDIAVDAAMFDIPIIGINLGHLGFLSQAEKGDVSIFEDIFAGKYSITKCMMLHVSITKNGEDIASFIALNDVVVSGGEYSKIINVSAAVNGTGCGAYSADGIIVASAVGSTAYSLSAGGAIMHPDLDAMIITPICPHILQARSIVIPGNDFVEINVNPPYRTEAIVSVDGKKVHTLNSDESVKITKSKYTTSLMRLEQRNFFDILREKLSD